MKAECAALRQRVEMLEDHLRAAEDRCAAAVQEGAEASAAFAKLQRVSESHRALSERSEQLALELDGSTARVAELERQVGESNASLANEVAARRLLETEVSEMSKELAAKAELLATREAETARAAERAAEDAAAVTGELHVKWQESVGAVDELEEQLELLRQENLGLVDRVDELEHQLKEHNKDRPIFKLRNSKSFEDELTERVHAELEADAAAAAAAVEAAAATAAAAAATAETTSGSGAATEGVAGTKCVDGDVAAPAGQVAPSAARKKKPAAPLPPEALQKAAPRGRLGSMRSEAAAQGARARTLSVGASGDTSLLAATLREKETEVRLLRAYIDKLCAIVLEVAPHALEQVR